MVKTIRLHANNMLPWIAQNNSTIKVIQLVRDPRAIFASQIAGQASFSRWTQNFSSLCELMEQDAQLENHLPSSRFAQIRYEDVVQNPYETLVKLHEKLELEMDLTALKGEA